MAASGSSSGGAIVRHGGIVTSKERHDWVNIGVSLRRRAETLSVALKRDSKAIHKEEKKYAVRQEIGDNKHSATTSGVLHGNAFGNENAPENGQREIHNRESASHRESEGILHRVNKTRAVVDAIQAQEDAESVSKLASFVTEEIESIRGKQKETYESLAKEEVAIFRQLKDLEMRIDGAAHSSHSMGSSSSARDDNTRKNGGKITYYSAFGNETPEAVIAYDTFMEENGQTGGVRYVAYQSVNF